MSEKPLTVIVVALLAIAVTLYLKSEAPPQQLASMQQGEVYGPAPDISIPVGPKKAHVDLSSMRGKVVILDFWATWCGPCKMAIPELQNVWTAHKNEDLKVIGISVDDPSARKDVDSTINALGMTYPVVMQDDIPDVRNKYQFASIPLMIIIDKKGIIRYRVNGYDSTMNTEKLVADLLKEKP
jgi:thiol-disulfide isomerase/thioredoxin